MKDIVKMLLQAYPETTEVKNGNEELPFDIA
jgi:hypothetical protein